MVYPSDMVTNYNLISTLLNLFSLLHHCTLFFLNFASSFLLFSYDIVISIFMILIIRVFKLSVMVYLSDIVNLLC